MPTRWTPSAWGKATTRSRAWELLLEGSELILSSGATTSRSQIDENFALPVTRGILWSTIDASPFGQRLRLRGISNRSAKNLISAVRNIQDEIIAARRAAQRVVWFDLHVLAIDGWLNNFNDATGQHLLKKGWLTREFVAQWGSRRPAGNLQLLLDDPDLTAHISAQPDATMSLIRRWDADLVDVVRELNEIHLESEMVECRDFFDTIEKSPLTVDQAKAVICFDNRVQVVASAGSGNTSTMVAKAAYALHRGLVPADQIILLAFNADAAKELQQRTSERLAAVGLDGAQVVARTFHAFGLDVIGQATGKKPSLAPWLGGGQDIEQVARIVDELRDGNIAFRTQWDLFRLVFGRDLPAFGKDRENLDEWGSPGKDTDFRTMQGEIVKSQGERMIADWLFYNGVHYEYEARYLADTADASHRQYQPDFYYPDIDTWHEHWALDEHGQPPTDFTGYLDGVEWKRALHKVQKTALLETTMSGLWDGDAFEYLARELTARGIVLDPNPDRPVIGEQPIENEQLVKTVRDFLLHAKSNRFDDESLRNRVDAEASGKFRYRHFMFLRLYAAIRDAWEQKLADGPWIDFEDMLNQAADHLEAGRWESPYELVMVDEMQDASHARARLANALVDAPGRHLFAVGDDWQSINRFAGADLSVMTDFTRWFGQGETLRLERTFRSPQSLCDISSHFVRKNPTQLAKSVVSSTTEFPSTVRAVAVTRKDEISGAIRRQLDQLNLQVDARSVPAGRNGKVSVLVLGRYNNDQKLMPPASLKSSWDKLDIRFLTIHGSKGLEADYVILPNMTKGAGGFPGRMRDDPVLRLAMPEEETFPLAEERRLLYVALTRARRSVLMITVKNRESPFLRELLDEHHLMLEDSAGKAIPRVRCPECESGSMIEKSGKYGRFFGCSEYPKCNNTMRTPTEAALQA